MNSQHRKDCTCSAHQAPARPEPRSCRFCLSWKRRAFFAGVCWHDTKNGATVNEYDTCSFFEPKRISKKSATNASDALPHDLAGDFDFDAGACR